MLALADALLQLPCQLAMFHLGVWLVLLILQLSQEGLLDTLLYGDVLLACACAHGLELHLRPHLLPAPFPGLVLDVALLPAELLIPHPVLVHLIPGLDQAPRPGQQGLLDALTGLLDLTVAPVLPELPMILLLQLLGL